MPIVNIIARIMDKLTGLKWGKIEIIVRDAKITQINRVEEDRL